MTAKILRGKNAGGEQQTSMQPAEWGVFDPQPSAAALTSKPCFSDGTHTSLLAAQSAWLAAEKADLDVGDPGPASMDKKRVTSLAAPPAGLDMVALILRRGKKRERGVSGGEEEKWEEEEAAVEQ